MKTTDELAKVIWDFNNSQEPIQKSDCILVLGNNDLRVAQYSAELFLKGYAPLIIFSGNEGNFTKDAWPKPEAEMFADIALKAGVSPEQILIENESTNTGENILFTKRLLKAKGLDPQSFILVQKPYMQLRALATFKKHLPDKEVYVTSPQISFKNYPNEFIPKEQVINAMIGDLQRLQVYPKKGFSVPIEIPQNVLDAYKELIARGYDKHLLAEI